MFTQYSYAMISLLPKLNPELWPAALSPELLSLEGAVSEGEDGLGANLGGAGGDFGQA